MLGILLYAYNADAGLILNRPLYIGLQDGLVGHWTFDGPDMAGERAFDRSGQGNTGLLTNGPVRRIGKIGQALEFDGSDDFVSIPAITMSDDYAVSAWIYPRTLEVGTGTAQNADTCIIGRNVAGDPKDFVCITTTEVGIEPDNVNLRITTNPSFVTNEWQHFAIVRSGATNMVYRNGVLVGSGDRSGSWTPTTIGKRSETVGLWNGLIDDVRIYNRVLSSDEIKRLHRIGGTLKLGVTRTDALTDGLVGHWTFDGQDMAGERAFDRSGQGNTGLLTNGPVRRIGKIGQALEFDGSDDLVNMGDVLDVTSAPLSIVAWIHPRSFGEGNAGTIVAKNAAGNGYGFRLDNTNSRLDVRLRNLDTTSNSNTVTLNTWQHVAFSWDGSTVAIYVNGSSAGGGASNNLPLDSTDSLVIGNQSGGTATFDGLIDDVRIYNRVLSSDEIKRLYSIGATFKIPAVSLLNLLEYWKFDEGGGSTAQDSSSNRNNFTVSGPTFERGKFGYALSFNNNGVQVGNSTAEVIFSRSEATVAMWIKTTQTSSANLYRESRVGSGQNTGNFTINSSGCTGPGALSVMVQTGGTSPTVCANGANVNNGEWHHVAVAYKGQTARIFKDGEEIASGGVGLISSDQSFLATSYVGLMDEVKVYTRALSAKEIFTLYRSGP